MTASLRGFVIGILIGMVVGGAIGWAQLVPLQQIEADMICDGTRTILRCKRNMSMMMWAALQYPAYNFTGKKKYHRHGKEIEK
jgi:predicted oxidoreductase